MTWLITRHGDQTQAEPSVWYLRQFGVEGLIQTLRRSCQWCMFYNHYLVSWKDPSVFRWSLSENTDHFHCILRSCCAMCVLVFSAGGRAVPLDASRLYLLPGQQGTPRTIRTSRENSLFLSFSHFFFHLETHSASSSQSSWGPSVWSFSPFMFTEDYMRIFSLRCFFPTDLLICHY